MCNLYSIWVMQKVNYLFSPGNINTFSLTLHNPHAFKMMKVQQILRMMGLILGSVAAKSA